jgi:hypothetical protein
LSSREYQIDLGDALMEVNTGTPTKRSRAKVKSDATEQKKTAAVVKKPRAPKKVNVATTITVTRAPISKASAVRVQPSADEIKAMIATAAYYLAAERHFSPGHELDDWLAAERRIQALFE